MASTQTQRNQFTAPLITGFHTSGSRRGRPICDYSRTARVVFLAAGAADPDGNGRITLKVHPLLLDSFVGLASVFLAHNYPFEEMAGGTVSCRNITGAKATAIERQIREQKAYATSLHAHGLATDINPSRNRYRRVSGLIQWGRQTDMSKAMVRDVEAIKTKAGKRALEWGGRWTNSKDPMHFENDLTRAELDAGINRTTIKGLADYLAFAGGGGAPPTNPDEEEQMLKRGDKGNAVGRIQTALKSWNPDALPKFGVDKDYGGETEAWVRNYQTAANLEPTGNTDGLTGAFLLEYVSDHAAGGGTGDFADKDHGHTATTTIT